MANETASEEGAFRRSAMNRVASADELDHYIKVTNPSAWVVAVAAFLLVVGIIVWAVVAIVPVTVNTTGVVMLDEGHEAGHVICWVDKSTADKIGESGAKASIDGVDAKSVTVASNPMSASEVVQLLGTDFYAASMDIADWNYQVTIEPGGSLPQSDFRMSTAAGDATLVPVSIVVSEKRPINIVLGKE